MCLPVRERVEPRYHFVEIIMAVSGVLTKRSGELVEFQHVIASKTAQGNKDDLHCLSHSLKKLQSDVNSCLTEIIKQETTAVCGCAPDSGGELM